MSEPQSRARHFGRLTAGDLLAIGDVIKRELPPLIRNELVKVGLATDDESDVIDLQKDHAFLRAARMRAEDDRRTVRQKAIAWLVPIVCCALVAGLAVLLGRHM